jgi:hypothetical protein
MDKLALVWRVLSEYFGFPASSHYTKCSMFINHPMIDDT